MVLDSIEIILNKILFIGCSSIRGFSQVARTLISDLKSYGVKVSKTTDISLSFGQIDQDNEVVLQYLFL